jgi:hypothetical protein
MGGLDAASVGEAVAAAGPDAIVHQMTGLSEAHAGKRPSAWDEQLELVRKRLSPWSGWHGLRLVGACRRRRERCRPGSGAEHEGVFNIVDDEPAPVSEWLPFLAECAGAKPPRRIPAWLARLLAGEMAVGMVTEGRGFSNAKAKRELGWELRS